MRAASRSELKTSVAELNVFSFLDFRDFLRALLKLMKVRKQGYSQQQFSKDLALGETNGVAHLLGRNRKVRKSTALKIVRAMGLQGESRKYFWYLIMHYNSRTPAEHEQTFLKLLAVRERNLVSDEQKRQLAFFSQWFHGVILEILSLDSCDGDPSKIARMLRFPISTEDLRASLALMESLGYIKKDEASGRYQRIVGDVRTDREVQGVAFMSFHRKMMELAKESLTRTPPADRQLFSITLALSDDTEQQLRDLQEHIAEFMMQTSARVEQKTKVVQVNMHMFPLTKPCATNIQR